MNVVVLGATSAIGADLACEFSPGNSVVLVGRDTYRLQEVAKRCRARGAAWTKEVVFDLACGAVELCRAIGIKPVELLINAAAATSRLRDEDIAPLQLGQYVAVDLTVPIELVRQLSSGPLGRCPRVIFVSSILAAIRSPRRKIYGSLKLIHEEVLRQLAEEYHELRPLIVRVAKWVDRDSSTRTSVGLAKQVRWAYDHNRDALTYGIPGMFLAATYYAQPLLFRLVIEMTNIARRLISRETRRAGTEVEEGRCK